MANKDTSKQWFETGDFPTQAQFAQVFEWLQWKDETIALERITGLAAYLNGVIPPVDITFIENGTYNIPAGYNVKKIFVNTPNASSIAVGTDVGGDDLVVTQAIGAATTLAISVDIPADNLMSIYFNVPATAGAVTTSLRILLEKFV